MKQATASKLFFSLQDTKPQYKGEGGELTTITASEMPGLVNLSFCELKLQPKGFLAPTWHPNAHKIGMCTQGKALVSLRTPEQALSFTVEAGELFFIPMGFPHQIEHCGNEECVIHFALSDTKPESMFFADAIHSLSDSVFKATFGSSGFVEGLKGESKTPILSLSSEKQSPPSKSSPYKFNIGKSPKTIQTKGGYLQLGVKKNLPVLDSLGILVFGLTAGGVVEPHWHTNAGELVFIVKGRTKITVLSPEGSAEELEVSAGMGAFAPASHFHNIENIGDSDVEVIAFFSHAEPNYIGIGEVLGSYSNDALGKLFNVQASYFDKLKKLDQPLVIVPI